MSLMSQLKDEKWKTAQRSDMNGLTMFTIVRGEMVASGRFKYAVKEVTLDGEGRVAMVTLDGAKGTIDPLKNIRNALLHIDSDVNEIKAIDLDGECVVKL